MGTKKFNTKNLFIRQAKKIAQRGWYKTCRELSKFLPVIKSNKLEFLHLTILSAILLLLLSSGIPLSGGVEEDILKYTNQFRKSKGLMALKMKEELNSIAQKHSSDMASGRKNFGHGGFSKREEQVKKIVIPFGGMGENVAFGARNGKEAFEIWKNSKEHRKNMLGNYKYIGIGTARDRHGVIYYTEIFVD